MAKLLLALTTLLPLTHAGPGLRPRISNASNSSSSTTKASRYDLPLSWASSGFLTTIDLGTPSAQVSVFVDWTWISQFLVGPKCWGAYDPDACLFPDQKHWDPRDSSTFKNLSGTYADRTWRPNHFFFEDPLHAEYGSDVVGVGPVTSEIVVQVSDLHFNASAYGYEFPFAGVFGLSPVYMGDAGEYPNPLKTPYIKLV